MLYNSKLTAEPFDGEITVKRGHKLITDAEGKVLGTLSKHHVLDLNGQEIAAFADTARRPNAEGKEQKCRIYTSSKGEMVLCDSIVFLAGEPIGKIPARERRAAHIILMAMLSLLLLATAAFVWMIDIPFSDMPQIEVADNNGTWEAQGKIAVLDSSIAPDSSGEYEFILDNPHNVSMLYDFSIKEFYNDTQVVNFPMEFRIRMNNVLLESDKWLSAEELNFKDLVILPGSTQHFTLEWRWQFESGDDETDTFFGKTNGEYSLQFQMIAQVHEEG